MSGIVQSETKFDSKPCANCKLRLHYTIVETCGGQHMELCKYCLPIKRQTCEFCKTQCFYRNICRQCANVFTVPKLEKEYISARSEITCMICKKILCRENKNYYRRAEFKTWLNCNNEPICEKCKPFENRKTICFCCKKHFDSSNQLHRHLRENVLHQFETSECDQRRELLKNLQTKN